MLSRKRVGGIYVISIVDQEGEERTFIATEIAFKNRVVAATINNVAVEFRLEQVADVVEVEDHDRSAIAINPTHHPGQRELL